MKKNYEIVIQTQLGRRNGLLKLDIMKDQIEGSFCFLKHTLPLNGCLLPDGHIELSGTFITLLKTHSYHAYGSIQNKDIHLELYERNHCYKAEGKEMTEETQ